ncbi:MAG TPA: hypothetical protein VM753_19115 [Anaeromyxobacter sp.]|jgi:hypothetical protein|nr:hypothetical protein [Anaeromyxobacter sp.]
MRWIAVAALVAAEGCATSTTFTGRPKVQNGVAGCQSACTAWGMELAGMVKIGEYSDGCICEVRRGAPPAAQPPLGPAPEGRPPAPMSALEGGGGGTAISASAIGVYLQMLASQQTDASRSPYAAPGAPGPLP